MIKELKELLDKYIHMHKTSEYVSIDQVTNDIYYLIQAIRIKRLPENER